MKQGMMKETEIERVIFLIILFSHNLNLIKWIEYDSIFIQFYFSLEKNKMKKETEGKYPIISLPFNLISIIFYFISFLFNSVALSCWFIFKRSIISQKKLNAPFLCCLNLNEYKIKIFLHCIFHCIGCCCALHFVVLLLL